jgi:YHS domain-containing protein
MKRYLQILSLALCGIVPYSLHVSAGEMFERDGFAIDGYDPVAYFTEQKSVKGSPKFRADFQGSTFQFVSAAHRAVFAADPTKYAPQYGGYCAYGMAKGYKAKIDPAAFTVVRDKLYLNYSESVRTRWSSNVPGYIAQADRNWPQVQTHTKVQE